MQILLLKLGETILKGNNRPFFEQQLRNNLKRKLKQLGKYTVEYAQSTFYVRPQEGADLDAAEAVALKLFGVVSVVRAYECEKDFEAIAKLTVERAGEQLETARTFRVTARRADKRFPMTSPQLSAELGHRILKAFPHLKVDLDHPDVTVVVEIRDYQAYIHWGGKKGAGGLPVGSSGRALTLISGGLDSPVASYMMAKRGLALNAIHFVSPPYTGPQALQKVEDLLGKISAYAGNIHFYIIPFTEAQEAIRAHCPEELFTIIMRRLMMRVSNKVAANTGCTALITGESLGQVASQTSGALICTDRVAEFPVFRPLIGMDKDEIVSIAHRIDTYDISILPYEDCCTVFTPRHPKTNPSLAEVEEAEKALDVERLVADAVEHAEKKVISYSV